MTAGATLDPATFRQLVADSPDAMYIACPDTDLLRYVNPALLELLGYATAGELVGRTAIDALVHPRDRALVEAALAARRAGGERQLTTAHWRRNDGSAVLLQGTPAVIQYDGAPAVLVTARRDAMLKTLRAAEERSRLLFDQAPVATCVIDRVTLEFLAVNQTMEALYGYSRDEFRAMTLSDVKLPEELSGLRADIDALGAVHTARVGRRRHRTKDGRVLDLDVTAHAVEFEGRDAVMAVAVDATESHRLEAQLRQAQKMEAVGQLAGGVAHDFNNLLGVILANVELALEDLTAPEVLAEELHEIESAAQRAAVLTRQLLAFSRKQPRRSEVISVGDIVTGCDRMLSRIVGEDIEISTVLAPDLAAIQGDASQLEQVLVNLVVNARDAMPSGGLLIVETRNVELDATRSAQLGVPPGAYVELAVQDTGTGMDAATRARVYEPFFTTKEVGKGTGLGLSTVFGIVAQSGGAIELESEPGDGTVFHVYFPAVVRPVESATSGAATSVPACGHEAILLVEDDPQLRIAIGRHLRLLGYTTHEAASANLGLELLSDAGLHVDLLVTDLVMPGLDGRAFALEAQGLRPGLRVVFMSGFTEHAAVKTARFEHDHFVEKPFTTAKLSHVIRCALQ